MKRLQILIQATLCIFGIALGSMELHSSDEKQINTKVDYDSIAKKSKISMIIQDGHTNGVNRIVFSPDGKLIASASSDKTIRLWNRKGILLKVLFGHNDEVSCLAFSPDGNTLISGSRDNTIRIWDMNKIGASEAILLKNRVIDIAYSPNGQYFISTSMGIEGVKIWSKNKTLIRTLNYNKIIDPYSIAFSPDGNKIASSHFGELLLFDIYGNLLKITDDKKNEITTSIAYSPDGQTIASGTRDVNPNNNNGIINIWNSDGSFLTSLTDHKSEINYLVFSPDSKTLISASSDKTVRFWSKGGLLNRWRLVKTLQYNKSVNGLAISPDGKTIATASIDRTIRLLNSDGTLKKFFPSYRGYITHVEFSPDDKSIIATSGGTTINLWKKEGQLQHVYALLDKDYIKKDQYLQYQFYESKYSPDGQFIFVPGRISTRIFDKEFKKINTMDSMDNILFSPDGNLIAGFKYVQFGMELKLWNKHGDLIKTLTTYNLSEADTARMAFSPDSQMIACSKGTLMYMWDKAGQLLNQISVGTVSQISSIKFNPDNNYFGISLYNGSIKLLTKDGNLIREMKEQNSVRTIEFSPNGKLIASLSSLEKSIIIWNIDGELIRKFEGHTDLIDTMAFSHDGKILVSGSHDNTIRLWNVENGNSYSLFTSGTDAENNPFLVGVDAEWLMFTSDGYWDGSRNSGNLVAMVKGMEGFAIDQFAVKNNRPDIIMKRMGLGTPELIDHYHKLYLRRLRRLGLTEDMLSDDLHVPETAITESTQEGRSMNLKISLKDDKYNLKRYNVYVNDVPLFGAYGKPVAGRSAEIVERIELSSGMNKIEVSCMNEKGAESYRALTFAEHKEKVKGDLYYIGFGVSAYRDASLNLKYAHKDALDLEKALSGMRGKFINVYAKTYVDGQVTVESIKGAKDFLKNAKVDDTFVLFIAGHGMHDTDREATYYYLTANADINNLKGTAADFDLIEDLLQGIAPRQKLFLMDTCESGELDDETERDYYTAENTGIKARAPRALTLTLKKQRGNRSREYLFQNDRYIYNDLLRRSGAIVLSSSKGGEFSFESDKFQNGHFTEEILKALSGKGDKNNDGIIDSDELRDFVSENVPKISDNKQHPTVDRDNIYIKVGLPAVR